MKKERITILQTSDLHGKIFPQDPYTNKKDGTGLLAAATMIKKVKAAETSVITIDNGDLFQGTPLMYYHLTEASHERNPMILGLNELGYDAFVLGNHEFNYGKRLLKKAQEESNFPWLSANIICQKTKEPYFGQPYLIKTLASGLKIGLLGLTTELIPLWEKPAHIKGMEFLDVAETAKKWVRFLREEKDVDCLIVSYHGGFEVDVATEERVHPQTKENQGYRLCQEVGGIDVLLTGHQHQTIAQHFVNDVLIVQPGKNGSHIGRVTLDFEKVEKDWRCIHKQAELIKLSECSIDETLKQKMLPYKQMTESWLDEPLGEVLGDMRVPSGMEARLKDHPYIELINQVQMEASGVDISLSSIFKNDTPGFKGKVTMRDVLANYIYPNSLKVLRVSGKDIKEALEQSASYFATYTGGEVKVSDAFLYPKEEPYNYDMWEGIEYEMNITHPVGKRITKLEYKGEPIKYDENYFVVMNNYRASGGGNYSMFSREKVVKDIQIDMAELLANYFKKKRIVQATCNHNWQVVY